MDLLRVFSPMEATTRSEESETNSESGLGFDRWQFDAAFAHASHGAQNQREGLDPSDFQYRGSDGRASLTVSCREPLRPKKWTPEFANDTNLLKLALCQRFWQYCGHNGMRVPLELTNGHFSKLREMVDRHFEEMVKVSRVAKRRKEFQKHVKAIRAHSGYCGFQLRIAWLAWRAGLDSVGVAQEMGIRPGEVRQILFKIQSAARSLGLPCSAPHPTARHTRPSRPVDLRPIIVLHLAGCSPSSIARRLRLNRRRVGMALGIAIKILGIPAGKWKKYRVQSHGEPRKRAA